MAGASSAPFACFVCAAPLDRNEGVALRGRGAGTARILTIRFHRACGPCLGVAVLTAIEPRPSARAHPQATLNPGLTPREEDVLQLLAAGDSNRQIARSLGISETYVKRLVSVVLSKLEVRCRTEAAVVALQAGLMLDTRGR